MAAPANWWASVALALAEHVDDVPPGRGDRLAPSGTALLMQASIIGGSTDNEVTELAVMP